MTYNKTSGPKILLVMISCIFTMYLHAQNLEAHQWKNRVLIVKSMDGESEQYTNQIATFTSVSEEMADRQLVLYGVTGQYFTFTNCKNTTISSYGNTKDLELMNVFNPKAEFEVVLIGLDGGIKLRQTNILTAEQLFSVIDTMPMRRSELKRKRKN